LELRYFNPFQNASVSTEGWLANFALKLVAIATSLEGAEKEILIHHLRKKYLSSGTKIVKIALIEIINLKITKFKKLDMRGRT